MIKWCFEILLFLLIETAKYGDSHIFAHASAGRYDTRLVINTRRVS